MAEDRMLSDEVLLALIKKNSGGGGGGGTDNYNDLRNKPQIAGTVLTGNKSLADLGIASATALGTVSDAVTAITDGQTIDSFSDVETALADKVDVVSGKGLSTNDYTNEDKAIVGGVTAALEDKVDKVDGKGLSTNDFTDAYKTAIGDNTTAISGIMDGQTIDSFSDVESALSDIDTTINGIKDGTDIDSFSDVETALDGKADKTDVKNEFIGTLAEWNALTTAQQKEYDTYQITDDYSEALMPNYSTTEQKTGQKWIDGSDIYVCVFDHGSDMTIGSSSYSDTNIAASGIAKIIEARAMQSNGTYKLINASCDATYVKITSPFSSDTVRYITLFYTKTA